MPLIIEKDWTTEAGLRAIALIITRADGTKSHRCGYVEVAVDSGFYGKSYGEQRPCITQEAVDNTTLGEKSPLLSLTAMCRSDDEGNLIRRSLDVLINCHGGLTFAGNIKDQGDSWFFGFDCYHYNDGELEEDSRFPKFYQDNEEAKSLGFVVMNCESIAEQLVSLMNPILCK